MLILLFVIFVALFILVSIFIEDTIFLELFGIIAQVCTVIGAVITVIAFVCVAYGFSKTMVVDDMIAMYTEENQNIERQIDVIVSEYMDYESGTFAELKGDSSITLVSLYPELKSDELVQTQIATYQANNTKLKELKEAKINTRVYKWWLYFGK